MPRGINKRKRFFVVRDKSDVNQGNISKILINGVNQETASGRDILIVSRTRKALKIACYEFYRIDPNTEEPVFRGRNLAEIRTYPDIKIEENP